MKFPEYESTKAHDFVIGNLCFQNFVSSIIDRKFDEVYQLAADMGGAGYIFTGDNDANVMYNSATINLNIIEDTMRGTLEELDIKTKVGFQSTRVAVTGTKISPPLFESIFALGKETSVARLAESIEKL